MKKILLIAVVFSLLFAFEGYAKKEAKPKAAKQTIGVVVSLFDLAKGGDGKLTKDAAEKKAESGSPVVLLVGSGKSAKVYFIYNSDGTLAAKKLAKYANLKKVGVTGAVKTVNGVNVIIADQINAMD